ncbi:MAG: A24 family peptidase [Pseudomonadota bacterium]
MVLALSLFVSFVGSLVALRVIPGEGFAYPHPTPTATSPRTERKSLLIVAGFASVPVLAWLTGATDEILLISTGLGCVLLILALIDLRSFVLPDVLTLPLALAGLGISLLGLTGPLLQHGVAMICGALFVIVLNLCYSHVRGQQGMGMGDAKLLAAAGAWTGIEGLLSTLMIGCAAGLLAAAGMALRSGDPLRGDMMLPFGPALALGFWMTWLFGPVALLLPGVR